VEYMSQLSRRDFLKVAGAAFVSVLSPRSLSSFRLDAGRKPNIIIILWDAFSARHLSLFGYPRLTTPNVDAFAERSTVFHAHYSGSNYTTCGTASMLTGMLPWKHGAINYDGLVRSEFVRSNPYTLLGPEYHRFAFSQNPWPDRLMGQYYGDVDRFLPPSAYSLLGDDGARILENDRAIASVALDSFLFSTQGGNAPIGSPVLGYLNKSRVLNFTDRQKSDSYSKGVPQVMNMNYLFPFRNEMVYGGVYSEISRLESEAPPYFAYFHLYSPHYPYRPRNDFRRLFRDDYRPIVKPSHPLSAGLHEDFILTQRTLYDRQIAQIDAEFGRLIASLDETGVLENSYLIFTSDHGEMFERGFVGHGFQFMYEPVLQIPLMIHAPGQAQRNDIHTPTSNIDLLPTLLSIAGREIPPDVDGRILPGFGGAVDEDRPIISMVATENSAFGPMKKAVISMRKRAYKLIAYPGYDGMDQAFELYDLENDPEELENLAAGDGKRLAQMKDELFGYLDAANRPFAGK